tara:strand:- start:2448 stop:2828 length:381 start_codon:yes stop_codon:yes gene_type:complete
MATSPLLLNQRQMAEAFDVANNTFANWKLPRAAASSQKGTEVFYDWGLCMYIVVGRERLKVIKQTGTDLEALAVSYIVAPDGGKSFTKTDTANFLKLAERGGYNRDQALIALGKAAFLQGVTIRQI